MNDAQLQALYLQLIKATAQRRCAFASLSALTRVDEPLSTKDEEFVRDQRERARIKVNLNVGGVHFSTSLATLLSAPRSMLAALFRVPHELEKDDEGRVFIDRDGELFKYVLQYLREGVLDVFALPAGVKDRLSCEAAFYRLPELEALTSIDTRPRNVYMQVEWSEHGDRRVKPPSAAAFLKFRGSALWIDAARLPAPPEARSTWYLKSSQIKIWWYSSILPSILKTYERYHLVSVRDDSQLSSFFLHFQRVD